MKSDAKSKGYWLGREGSNLRMAESKSASLTNKSIAYNNNIVKPMDYRQWVTGELSNLGVADINAKTDTPATAATEAGANTQTGSKKPGTYQGRIARAIISYTLGPDCIVQAFAMVEVLP